MIGSSDRATGSRPYKAGVAVALVTSFLIVWTTIVRDEGNGIGFFMVIMAAAVAGFAASFRPAGMARAMAGVAIMQVLLGIAIATAPSTANVPGGPFRILVFSGFFTAFWMIAASCFGAAAKGGRATAAAH